MNVIKVKVPSDIQYISEWKGYQIPFGKCIIDKGVTGCGFTEFCLRNSENLILCSPRKLLLKNKKSQHSKDLNIFYEDIDFLSSSDVSKYQSKLDIHLSNCSFAGLPVKILITYDSISKVIDILKNYKILKNFRVVIDEFQSIFLDSYFKSGVEFNFVEHLQDCSDVCYLSATPMLEEYLGEVDEFKDLDYYKFDWEDSPYIEKLTVEKKYCQRLNAECKGIISKMLSGKFESLINHQGKIVQSKEAVFYFNSVSDIIRIIKSADLTPANTRIICSNIERNRIKIKKLSSELKRKFTISEVPTDPVDNKMFTFCTRSVYLGADFYSDNASSYVFSDPNIQSLALDISLDLPQIVGRQRNKENPWKNRVTIFYRLLEEENAVTIKNFSEIQEKRRQNSYEILDGFTKLSDKQKSLYLVKLISDIKLSKYCGDFISISKDDYPVYNKFIELANRRAWEISQKDFADIVSVTKALGMDNYEIVDYQDGSKEKVILEEFLKDFGSTMNFEVRLKLYCDFLENHQGSKELIDAVSWRIPEAFRTYLSVFTSKECKSLNYKEANLRKKINAFVKESEMKNQMDSSFKVGQKYTKKDIKNTLAGIYKALDIDLSPKASDLERFFEVKACQMTFNGKRVNGFQIISKK